MQQRGIFDTDPAGNPLPILESDELGIAKEIIARLEGVFETLSRADQRFVMSWRQYLDRTGQAARIGVYRLALICATAASYGLIDEQAAKVRIEEALQWAKGRVE